MAKYVEIGREQKKMKKEEDEEATRRRQRTNPQKSSRAQVKLFNYDLV